MTEPRVLGTWLNDADLAEACRRRADELAMSYEEIDRIAGLVSGHTSKVLSVPQAQGFGPVSRFTIPWALQMKFGLIDAPEHTRPHVRRITRAVRRGKRHHRNAKALALVSQWGRNGARIALKNLGPPGVSKQRSEAAKARWKAWRRERRASRGSGTSQAASPPGPGPARRPPRSAGNAAPKAPARPPSPAMPV